MSEFRIAKASALSATPLEAIAALGDMLKDAPPVGPVKTEPELARGRALSGMVGVQEPMAYLEALADWKTAIDQNALAGAPVVQGIRALRAEFGEDE
jgi:hypothetical protein